MFVIFPRWPSCDHICFIAEVYTSAYNFKINFSNSIGNEQNRKEIKPAQYIVLIARY